MKRLAVIFPGIGYTADKPLLYYSRRLAEELGYEIRIMNYQGFPPKIMGDRKLMEESYLIAFNQTQEMLSGIALAEYEDILFIGKSIGTIVAAKIASESSEKDRIRLILYTPLPETFACSFGESLVFTGAEDPWVGKKNSPIFDICKDKRIPCFLIKQGNHSLESNDTMTDLKELFGIMKETERFLRINDILEAEKRG